KPRQAKPAPQPTAKPQPVAAKPPTPPPPAPAAPRTESPRGNQRLPSRPVYGGAPRPEGEKPLASPAVRKRARDAGIDLRQVPGTGPAGRITHADLDAFVDEGTRLARAPALHP